MRAASARPVSIHFRERVLTHKLADDIRGILSDDQVAHWQGEARKTAALIEDLVGQAWPGVPQTPEIWIAADLLAKLAEGSS